MESKPSAPNLPGPSEDENHEKRRLRSKDLFLGSREIIIEHNNDHYRLVITKSGKLILNK